MNCFYHECSTEVKVQFEKPSYTVDEGTPTVEVCFNSSTGTKQPFDVIVAAVEKPASSNPATRMSLCCLTCVCMVNGHHHQSTPFFFHFAVLDDFLPGQEAYTFSPSENGQRFCAMISIVDEDICLEGDEEFRVIFTNLPNDDVGVGTNNEACVTITDNDTTNDWWRYIYCHVCSGYFKIILCVCLLLFLLLLCCCFFCCCCFCFKSFCYKK